MRRLTALLDACVLYPAPLRDLLMHLALADLFRAKWTDEIHEEWMRSVLETRPDLRREQLERTRSLMNAHVRDCIVTGYENLIPALTVPDPDDRHVVAAAIRASAEVLVTFNLKVFPQQTLASHRIDVQHPDGFVLRLMERDSATVCAAAQRQRLSLKNPSTTVEQFLVVLERQGLAKTDEKLRRFVDFL